MALVEIERMQELVDWGSVKYVSTGQKFLINPKAVKTLTPVKSGASTLAYRLLAMGDEVSYYITVSSAEAIAEEIESGGGVSSQLLAPLGLSLSGGVLTWTLDRYADSYNIYLDGTKVDDVTLNAWTIPDDASYAGSHVLGVSEASATMLESDLSTVNYTAYSISVSVVDGTYVAPNIVMANGTAVVTITPSDVSYVTTIDSVTGASYSFDKTTGVLTLSNPTGNISVQATCALPTAYVIGFSGMSQSTPALTRTDDAVGASWAASLGIIEVTGLDMEKIWGGYVGNDGEEVTWDANAGKWMSGGSEYTGNVFSKINRFFVKPSYVMVDGVAVLDGYQLCYADEAPDATWEDWFYGKSYVGIGCYKGCGGSTLVSKPNQNIFNVASNGDNIVTAYKNASTSSGSLHEKWFNENAILQVLFMAIFATRQTEDVFPQGTYRSYSDTKRTGYMDNFRRYSTIATGYTVELASGANMNMFLGIEDFIGWKTELVCGVVFNDNVPRCSMDYANFSYSGSYTVADVNLNNYGIAGQTIKYLQQSSNTKGLLIPKVGTGETAFASYFCDVCYYTATGIMCWFQDTFSPNASGGVFTTYTNNQPSTQTSNVHGARLCRTPA